MKVYLGKIEKFTKLINELFFMNHANDNGGIDFNKSNRVGVEGKLSFLYPVIKATFVNYILFYQ